MSAPPQVAQGVLRTGTTLWLLWASFWQGLRCVAAHGDQSEGRHQEGDGLSWDASSSVDEGAAKGGLAAQLLPAAVLNSPESLPGKERREGQLCLWCLSFLICAAGERGGPRDLSGFSKLRCTFNARCVSPSRVLLPPAWHTCPSSLTT